MNQIIIAIDNENRIIIEKDENTNITTIIHQGYGFGDAGDEWSTIKQMEISTEL